VARLRALREWLLRLNRRPRYALGSSILLPGWRVLVGVLCSVAALRPWRLWRYAQAGDLPGYGPQIDGGILQELVAANTGENAARRVRFRLVPGIW
jgi:hypothetical protein